MNTPISALKALAIASAILFMGPVTGSASAAEPTVANAQDPALPYAGEVTVSGGFTGDVIEGSDEAKVTVIEYASLSCPHCANFHKTIYPQLKSAYIETGKVRFIYRDFPLNEAAMVGTMIARCSGQAGYTAMIDALLTNQDQWLRAQDVFSALLAQAKFAGMDQDRVYTCLEDQQLGQSVLQRRQLAVDTAGVNSTPTLLIDGVEFSQTGDFQAISQQIDALLTQ